MESITFSAPVFVLSLRLQHFSPDTSLKIAVFIRGGVPKTQGQRLPNSYSELRKD